MRILLHAHFVLYLLACSSQSTSPGVQLVLDKSTIRLENSESITQLLTNQGLKYLDNHGERIEHCLVHQQPCKQARFSVTAMDLYYDDNIHGIYLLKEMYHPDHASDIIVLDTLLLSSPAQHVFFFDVIYHQASSSAQVHKPRIIPVVSHLITQLNDQILYNRLHVQGNKIIENQYNSVPADSIVFSLHRHHTDPIIFQFQDLYGLLGFHKSADFKKVEPFIYNYARAQHSSGVWGYLKKDGEWFPDR